MAKTAKATSWYCQPQSTKNEISPTRKADRPSQSMKVPGAITSMSNSTAARMNQSQKPSVSASESMATTGQVGRVVGTAVPADGGSGRPGGGADGVPRPSPKA